MQALNLKEEAAKLESQLVMSCNNLKLSEECHLLGRFLEIVKKDVEKAAAVYKSNCVDGQNGDSCFYLGQLYHTETGMVDHREAYHLNRRGCELGNAKCCLGAALANFSDDLDRGCLGKNQSLALDYMKRSCHLGSADACHLLSGVYVKGIPGVVERDLSAALKHNFEARLKILNPATLTPSSVKFVMKWDPKDAEEMGKLLPQLGTSYVDKCYLDNSPKDCHYLAHFMLSMKEAERAAILLRSNCDGHQYGESCYLYADLLRSVKFDRRPIKDDQIESFHYYQKGCEFGHAKSCFNTFGALLNDNVRKQEKNPDMMAVKLLDRGCDLGSNESCYLAGGAYLIGLPGVMERNVSTTYKYDVKACQLGNKLACANLSGALPIEMPIDDQKSNAFQIRLMQLTINKQREENLQKFTPKIK